METRNLKSRKGGSKVQRVATRAARIACAEATTDNVAAGQKAYAEALEESAAEEEAVAPMEFTTGQKVMFTGLTNPYGPAFNGKCGFIQAWNDEKQRFEVSITSNGINQSEPFGASSGGNNSRRTCLHTDQ